MCYMLAVKQEYLIMAMEGIDMVDFLPTTGERLPDLREKTECDESF